MRPSPSAGKRIEPGFNFTNCSFKKYYNAITPKDYEAYLEFKENNHIDLCVLKISNKSETKICLFQEWDIDPYNYKHNSMSDIPAPPNSPKKLKFEEITTLLNWNTNTFKKIKEYLDKATCISITNGEPTNIGYKRSGMGEYFYNIFDNSIDKDKVKFYNDSCKYRLYNEKIVLEYGGGAIGSQCFPGN